MLISMCNTRKSEEGVEPNQTEMRPKGRVTPNELEDTQRAISNSGLDGPRRRRTREACVRNGTLAAAKGAVHVSAETSGFVSELLR